MANANLPKASNGAGHFGDISPEDAERFAAAFKPMWEFDDAPFAAAPANLTASEVRQLQTVNPNADLLAAMHAPITAPVHNPAPARPAARPAGRPPAPRAAAAVPQRATGRDASVDLDLPSLKKSNKGIFLAVGGVVAAVALFFGVRAALSGPDTPASPLPTASPVSHEEPKIPPPPAPDPVPAATTVTAAVTTAAPAPEPPKPEPAKVDPPKPAPVQVSRPEPPPPPPRAAAPHYNPPPRAPAPQPVKKPSSGIVRDNPF